MNTPEFDKITNKPRNDKLIRWLRTTKLDASRLFILGCFFLLNMSISPKDSEARSIMKTDAFASYGLALVLFGTSRFVKKLKNGYDNDRKLFTNAMSGAFINGAPELNTVDYDKEVEKWLGKILDVYDSDDYAKMAIEYVLSFMTADEKKKIQDAYGTLRLSSVAREVVAQVFDREPGLRKIVNDADGKTCKFKGWDYGVPGHGGR